MDERTYNIYKSIIDSTGNNAKVNSQRNRTHEVIIDQDKVTEPIEFQNNEKQESEMKEEPRNRYAKYHNNRMGSMNRRAYQHSYGRNLHPKSYHNNYNSYRYNNNNRYHDYAQKRYPITKRRYSISPERRPARTQEEINSERRGATSGPGRGLNNSYNRKETCPGLVETVQNVCPRIYHR
uniref:Uncharacterized protein n=1 Tax=Acrobeloides nanus TaxID=290746 RepID=A0A914EPI9_9BILA